MTDSGTAHPGYYRRHIRSSIAALSESAASNQPGCCLLRHRRDRNWHLLLLGSEHGGQGSWGTTSILGD